MPSNARRALVKVADAPDAIVRAQLSRRRHCFIYICGNFSARVHTVVVYIATAAGRRRRRRKIV